MDGVRNQTRQCYRRQYQVIKLISSYWLSDYQYISSSPEHVVIGAIFWHGQKRGLLLDIISFQGILRPKNVIF